MTSSAVSSRVLQCPKLCPGPKEMYCVPEYRLCDGKFDCKDTHADEEDCEEV